MLQLIMKILIAVFALVGILELYRVFLLWFLKTDNPGKLCLVVPVCGHDEEAEFTLRTAAERARWIGRGETQIICADCGMDEETRRICELMTEDFPEIVLCPVEEIGKTICS